MDKSVTQVPLSEELRYVKDYLRIKKNRLEHRLEYTLEVDESLLSLSVPKLILQPLVENAILHGIEPCEQGGCVHLRVMGVNAQVHIEVSDNGGGMSADQVSTLQQSRQDNPDPGSIGLRKVVRRLKLL